MMGGQSAYPLSHVRIRLPGRRSIGGEGGGQSRSSSVHIFPSLVEILGINGPLHKLPVGGVGLRDEP
jgi:hypothetical protein